MPNGWVNVRLPNLCAVNPPKPRADEVASDTPVTFVPMPAVDADAGAITAPQSRVFATVRKGFTSFRDGDVIVAKITPCFENGKAAICRGLLNGLGFGSTEFHVLRSNGAVTPEYLYHFVRQESFRRDGAENMTGSVGQKRVPADWISSVVIPLPPAAEQKRIVAKVEALLARVSAARERLAKVPTLLKRFRQSVLAAACSGQLTADWREQHPEANDSEDIIGTIERLHKAAGGHKQGNAASPTEEAHDLSIDALPSCWRMTDLRTAVCPDRPITYGILKPGPDTPGGIPYVRVADFPNDRLSLNGMRRTTPEIDKAYSRARLRQGDILLSIRGTVGRVCVVPPELTNANITQDTARLSIQPSLNTCFIMWFLRAAPTQKRMQKAIKGVAVRGINIGDVRALQVPVPPLAEQQEIVRRVEALFALADKIEARVEAATARVEKITQAILAKAFRGELVPTEAELAREERREYEPASVLLERIRANRAANTNDRGGPARYRMRRKHNGHT